MKIISIIHDSMLNADSMLFEMKIAEYLSLGGRILDKNPFQRRRVMRSSTMYGLLSRDLLKLCTMPPIVLALSRKELGGNLSLKSTEEDIRRVLTPNNLFILDGLQRTYTMLGVVDDLLVEDADKEKYLDHMIRVEVYVGLSKTGILYRMLTLNSGQTPMSKRHEIEILYSDFNDGGFDNIKFVRQIDSEKKQGIDMYDFDDAIEGFNSFLNADESPIDRFEILEIVERLEVLANNDYEKDVFKDFIIAYNKFVHHLDTITDSWEYKSSNDTIKSVYGKDLAHIFCKSQTLSAFGAAVGSLIEDKKIKYITDITDGLDNIKFEENVDETFYEFLCVLDQIRQRAPKIGVEQRLYLKLFFRELFDPSSSSSNKMMSAVKSSFDIYKEIKWKQNTIEEISLF